MRENDERMGFNWYLQDSSKPERWNSDIAAFARIGMFNHDNTADASRTKYDFDKARPPPGHTAFPGRRCVSYARSLSGSRSCCPSVSRKRAASVPNTTR